MTQINLLPWREEARDRLKVEYLTKLGAVVAVAAFMSIVWVMSTQSAVDTQRERNSYLQKNIAEMDKKVSEVAELKKKKAQMISRMTVIQDLQGNRAEIVKAFDELVRSVPDGVYLSQLSAKSENVKMVGFAESNNRISTLMRNLDKSYKYKDSNLTKVTHDQRLGDQGSGFDLQVGTEKSSKTAEVKNTDGE